MLADQVNALFEVGGALAILLSLRRLIRDKRLAGFDPLTLAFFTVWGFWNLAFYPAVGATWSFLAGLAVVAVNSTYLAAMAWYARPARTRRAILRRLRKLSLSPGTRVSDMMDARRGAARERARQRFLS